MAVKEAHAFSMMCAYNRYLGETRYPGQAGGTALAEVLFGNYNPGGRLPVTFYKSVNQLPPFRDYKMRGRTYRYFEGKPLYPFGHGLSYTKFRYSNLKFPGKIRAGQKVMVLVDVENIGEMSGDEVVQLYLKDLKASVPVPIRSLQGFKRIFLKPGEKRTVHFTLNPRQLSLIDNNFRRVIEPGFFEVCVGGKQPGFTGSANAATTEVIKGKFEVIGEVTPVK